MKTMTYKKKHINYETLTNVKNWVILDHTRTFRWLSLPVGEFSSFIYLRVACRNLYRNLDFWSYVTGSYSPLFELAFDTRVTLFSQILHMPRLIFNAHSWCIGWCTVLLGCIVTLLSLGPNVAGLAPLVCHQLHLKNVITHGFKTTIKSKHKEKKTKF